ncbi:MAG: hypothetical protein JXA73_15970 [Acidobacteria bacterium]|nr:hypothetical protein [Acidobacteriota bacterium]
MDENPLFAAPESVPVSSEPLPVDVALTAAAQQYLSQTGPWIRFLAILLFIFSGLTLLIGMVLILMGFAGILSPGSSVGGKMLPSGLGVALLGPIYGLMAILGYLVPGILLFRYASAIKALQSSRSAQVLENALKHQKSFWRYLGILTIILLIIGILVFAATFLFAFFLSMQRQTI